MHKSLLEKIFGSRHPRDAAEQAHKKETTLAMINEIDHSPTPARARRTVGLTEERLRAANRQSWLSSGKGWGRFFGRFGR
ncbi:MAG TPA: hypothetical protein VM053_07500 [Gemmatimonadaceae bacterium]|nr:hypothetical protein [Gemmatimonadaceae bacterium]